MLLTWLYSMQDVTQIRSVGEVISIGSNCPFYGGYIVYNCWFEELLSCLLSQLYKSGQSLAVLAEHYQQHFCRCYIVSRTYYILTKTCQFVVLCCAHFEMFAHEFHKCWDTLLLSCFVYSYGCLFTLSLMQLWEIDRNHLQGDQFPLGNLEIQRHLCQPK